MIFCQTAAVCMLFQILDKKSDKISMALIKFFLIQVLAGKLRGLHILDVFSRTSTLIIFSSLGKSIANEAGLSVCEEVEILTKLLTSLSPPPPQLI